MPVYGNTPTSNVYNSNNQISGSSYDGAGNQTSVNGNSVAYDGENRVASVTSPPNMGGGAETMAYDGLGQRVLKTMPGGTNVYVYDAFGELAAEYSTTGQTPPCTTCYLSTDHLGSIRLVTDASTNVVARHDFLPFGEEIPAGMAERTGQWGSTTDTEQKFTGQVRDQESGMDFFNARYFAMPLGRFTSPDPGNAGADPSDPQSWNAYSYVRNGPMNAVDPSGMYLISPGDPGDWGGNPCFVYDGSCAGPGPVPPPCWNCVSGGGGGGGGGGRPSGGSAPPPPSSPPVSSYPGIGSLGSANIRYSCDLFGGCWIPVPNAYLPAPAWMFSVTKTEKLPNPTNSGTQPLQPTTLRLAWPFWQLPFPNYCGPGTGSGSPVNQVDAACQVHDLCYQNAGVTGADILNPARSAAKTAGINACGAQLCNRLTTIVPENRTENGDAFFVGLFFSVSHGSLSACIP